MKKRILSIVIIFALYLNMIPFGSMAAEQDDTKVCSHHPEHTADCGYVEAVPGSPCTHEHTEECYRFVTKCVHEHTDECYTDVSDNSGDEEESGSGDASGSGTEQKPETDTGETSGSDTEQATESDVDETSGSGEDQKPEADMGEASGSGTEQTQESGAAQALAAGAVRDFTADTESKEAASEQNPDSRELTCSHVCSEESGCIVRVLDCKHEHDENCGYVEAVEGHPCGFVCRICPLQEMIDALPKKVTEENQEEVKAQLEEILEKYQALTEEEKKQVDLSRYEKLKAMLGEDEEVFDVPYYLFLVHSLSVDVDGDGEKEQYGSTELVELNKSDFKDDKYDMHKHALQKEGMETVRASYLDKETYELKEGWTISLSDFDEGGDPEDGSNYYAVQALIEYGVADGYRAVVSDNPSPAEDPYGIMPLVGFTGGNLVDIEFEPANIATVTVNYMYSPTGGLSGMPAAAPKEYQIPVTKDKEAVLENVIIPNAGEGYPNLEGFRIVLDSHPLNAFLVNPELADEMSANPNPDTIKSALENDLFTIDPSKDVYSDAGNGYSDTYNAAWNEARDITKSDDNGEIYTAAASSATGNQNLGATALTNPRLTVTIPSARVNQILEAGVDSEAVKTALTVTVYYRRNAGTYKVNHWVPNLLSAEQAGKDSMTHNGVTYWNVYPETKQGRIGAMTNAISGMDQMDRTGEEAWLAAGKFDFRPYVTEGFAQQIVDRNGTTEVDVYYGSASEYRIIFNTDTTYIPRVSAEANDTLTFDYSADNAKGQLRIKNSSGDAYSDTNRPEYSYQNPTRTGYRFVSWRYEVKNGDVDNAYPEDGKYYVDINSNNNYEFKIKVDNGATVIVLANDEDSTVKAIYLYPKWESASASVRVVFWTEDLGGENHDVDVNVSDRPSNSSYLTNLDNSYLSGTPGTVGTSFSNAGSFTFTATTGAQLNLSVSGSDQSTAFETTTPTSDFQVTGEASSVRGNLTAMIDAMFQNRMPDVTPTAVANGQPATVNTSVFYHPYAVMGADAQNNFTVAADGSTVINVRYARYVYSLDFTYYGSVSGYTSVATNTKGYSRLSNPSNFDAQNNNDASDSLKNTWQRVSNSNNLTVPQKVTISAKYGADLREVWPRTYGETIDTANSGRPTFTSWGTTAGGYNQRFKNNSSEESTLMGVYSAMGVDIIANPSDSSVTHHLYAYWCPSKNPSRYRFNHCFEVPDLTWGELTGAPDTVIYDLRNKTVDGTHTTQTADTRADTLYLVPVNGALGGKFSDYSNVLLQVNRSGVVADNGGYYAVRRYSGDEGARVYALARQVDAISTNTIANQNPSARLHMTRANNKPDHATNASDTDGYSTYDVGSSQGNYAIGSASNPYDLFFYYDRDRMTITYMVPARDSDSGEYTLGTKEVPYGASLSKYNVILDGNPSSAGNQGTPDNKRYSNDPKFADFWQAYSGVNNSGTGLSNGYARTAPNSAENGKGIWTFQGWSLDRALTQSEDFTGTMSGNLRLFANWKEPTYQVRFELEGGALANGSMGPITQDNLRANQGYTSNDNAVIPRPIRNGYTLSGWEWYEEDGTTPVANFTFESPITRNMVARAKWSRSATTVYKYKVWYLTNDPEPVTRKEGEGWLSEQESGTVGSGSLNAEVNTGNYTKILGCKFFTGQYPTGTNLLLGAESFTGYIPYNGNASILLEDTNPDATPADTEYVAYFYYNKAVMKKYTIQFQPIRINDGGNDGAVLDNITQEGGDGSGLFYPQ